MRSSRPTGPAFPDLDQTMREVLALPALVTSNPRGLLRNAVDVSQLAAGLLYVSDHGVVSTLALTAVGSGSVTSIDVSGGTTGLTTSGGPVTTAGTITLAGTLAVANGGTGATTAAAARTALGLVIGTNVQAWDSDLDSIAALATTAYGRSFLTLADASAGRTLMGVVIGTDVQAFDADLASIAALATTAYGRSFLTLADASAGRTLLGSVIGTDVQAFDADLAEIAAIANAVGDLLVTGAGPSWAALADIATGNVLLSGGVGVLPAYGKVGLTTHVSGILPVANGGTGASSLAELIGLVDLSDVGAKTGTGTTVVMQGSPALTTPTIADFTNATHAHTSAGAGGTLDTSALASGTLAVARGGTSFSSYTVGDLIQASGAGTLAQLAAVATGSVLISGGVGVASSWGKVGLTTHVSGVLGVANGGTSFSAYTIGDLIHATGTTTLTKLAAVATGNALISGGVGAASSWGKIGLTTHVSGILPVANGGTGSATDVIDVARTWASLQKFPDDKFGIVGSATPTKILVFEVDGLSVGTRTLTPQDASYVIAGTNYANNFNVAQTFTSTVSMEPLSNVVALTVRAPGSTTYSVECQSAGSDPTFAIRASTGEVLIGANAAGGEALTLYNGYLDAYAGSVQLDASLLTGARTISFPDLTGVLITDTSVDLLLNKTLASSCDMNCSSATTGVAFRDQSTTSKKLRVVLSGVPASTNNDITFVTTAARSYRFTDMDGEVATGKGLVYYEDVEVVYEDEAVTY